MLVHPTLDFFIAHFMSKEESIVDHVALYLDLQKCGYASDIKYTEFL